MESEIKIKSLDEIAPTNNTTLVDTFLQNNILTNVDIQKLTGCKDFILDTYTSVPMYRSLAIKIFGVLNNKEFPTNESKYWQCKTEAEVHANEVIRDLHDMQIETLKIEKNEWYLSNVLSEKYKKTSDETAKKEIEFDMKELVIRISRQRFELSQLRKKIKYRIDEINDWKSISEKLIKIPNFKNGDYNMMLTDLFSTKWNADLQSSEITDEAKVAIKSKLDLLQAMSALKPD